MFFEPPSRFELGAALFIGWAGSVLCILGGLVFCLSLSEGFGGRQVASFDFQCDPASVVGRKDVRLPTAEIQT